jgi:hypothetical protein
VDIDHAATLDQQSNIFPFSERKLQTPVETLIVRLLAQRELRFRVARFTDNPDKLAISNQRE